MPKLSEAETRRFLEEPGLLMDIATLDSDGWPAVCPIWYLFEEGTIWFTPRSTPSGWPISAAIRV